MSGRKLAMLALSLLFSLPIISMTPAAAQCGNSDCKKQPLRGALTQNSTKQVPSRNDTWTRLESERTPAESSAGKGNGNYARGANPRERERDFRDGRRPPPPWAVAAGGRTQMGGMRPPGMPASGMGPCDGQCSPESLQPQGGFVPPMGMPPPPRHGFGSEEGMPPPPLHGFRSEEGMPPPPPPHGFGSEEGMPPPGQLEPPGN